MQEARIFTRIPLEEGNASGRNDILAVFGQHLYLGVVAHGLDAMSTLDGALLWQRQVGLPLGETLLEANGVVYIPSGISIDALNAHDGTRLWSRDADPDSSFGTLLFVHNVLFVAEQPVPLPARIPHGEGSSTLFALNAGNGSVYWRIPGGGGVMAITDSVVRFPGRNAPGYLFLRGEYGHSRVRRQVYPSATRLSHYHEARQAGFHPAPTGKTSTTAEGELTSEWKVITQDEGNHLEKTDY